jgi:hypothetical protein
VIDYDELVDAYRRSLTSVLRGFRAGDHREPFLETWVPDEDDARSVAGIFEAASAAGVERLALRFGAQTAARLGSDALRAIGARFGACVVSREGDAAIATVTFDGTAVGRDATASRVAAAPRLRERSRAPSPPLPPVSERAARYDAALAALGPFTHEGAAKAAGTTRLAVDHAGATLELLVDGAGIIVAARHRGGDRDVASVLEALCRVVESLPLREAADHGAARLELALRGRDGARVVPGIVSPDNADPRLGACARSLRALAAEHACTGGAIEASNTFVPPLVARWAAASPADRESAARDALAAAARELALAPNDVALAAPPGDARVLLAFDPAVPAADRPRLLFDLERALKRRLDDGITVYLEEMADKNRIRRLVVKPPHASKNGE